MIDMTEDEIEDLFWLIIDGKTDEFLKEVERFDVNVTWEDDENLLQQAIAIKHVEIAKHLIEKGINVNHQDTKGTTALHYLADHPNVEIAKLILEKGGDVNLKDKHGNNALLTALAKHAGIELIKLYKEAGADLSAEDNGGNTVMDLIKRKDPEHPISKLFEEK